MSKVHDQAQSAGTPLPQRDPVVPSVAAFKALAHPLRMHMFHRLEKGPATATMLAEELNESTGSTSYHLRQLARHGLIEQDPDRGTARERWWKVVGGGMTVPPEVALQDVDATRSVMGITLTEWHHEAIQALNRVLSGADSTALAQVSCITEYSLTVTAEEFQSLLQQVDDLFQPYRTATITQAADDAIPITVRTMAFPKEQHG